MSELQTKIDLLGNELTACGEKCAGICRDQSKGIMPRSLFLERPDANGRGCIVIGINPATSLPPERKAYLKYGITYKGVNEYRREKENITYFKRVRLVIGELNLPGPILWSNLAKCENTKGRKGLPPVLTIRRCVGRFLHRELEIAPPDWPILTLGRDAYSALIYLAPQRAVIGIPHPTGSRQDFPKMFTGKHLRKAIANRAAQALSSSEAGVVWLGRKP